MLLPLHGFVEGDSLGVIVLVHDTDKVQDLAAALAAAAAPRVAQVEGRMVFRNGRLLHPDATIAQEGLEPLDRVDLRKERDGNCDV